MAKTCRGRGVGAELSRVDCEVPAVPAGRRPLPELVPPGKDRLRIAGEPAVAGLLDVQARARGIQQDEPLADVNDTHVNSLRQGTVSVLIVVRVKVDCQWIIDF